METGGKWSSQVLGPISSLLVVPMSKKMVCHILEKVSDHLENFGKGF
jgi:hypothetical protein